MPHIRGLSLCFCPEPRPHFSPRPVSHSDHSLRSTPQSWATVYSQLTPSPGMWLAKSHSCPAHSFHRTSWIQRRLTNGFFIKRNFPQDTCQLPCKLIWQSQTHNPRLSHTQKMAGIQTLPCSPLALLPSGRSWPSLQRHAPALTVKGCLYFWRDVPPQKVKKNTSFKLVRWTSGQRP